MTALETRIRRMIASTGPMPVSDYMALCLFDAKDGYYTTREPFGRGGDFVTAPEISQMFGEMIAVWLYAAWIGEGSPDDAIICEIGAGRGTLMRDVLRTLDQIAPQMRAGTAPYVVEISPRLEEVQRATLGGFGDEVRWLRTIDTLPQRPLFVVANELFDAVPMRQFVRHGPVWRERCVGVEDQDRLCFTVNDNALLPQMLPLGLRDCADGTVFETAPQREAMMDAVSRQIATKGGAGLFIDYGALQAASGDTFQAVREHAKVSVFDTPGQADLTSHVDFAALTAVAETRGVATAATTQGAFLSRLGIAERAGQLGAGKTRDVQGAIVAAVTRLVSADAMGELFKVLAVYRQGITLPGFDDPHGN
jgi:SAM-dependent MidA family methyltransferase